MVLRRKSIRTMPNVDQAVATVLLSAGTSSRFGGAPKALLRVAGQPAVRRMAELALEIGATPVILVTRPGSDKIVEAVAGLGVIPVVAFAAATGRTASIQAGVAALPRAVDVLLWPVDHSFVRRRTLERLILARQRELLGRWFVPTFGGRGGHPVLFSASVRAGLGELGADQPLRALQRRSEIDVVRVPVNDPAVAQPIDTPEAYRIAVAQERVWIES